MRINRYIIMALAAAFTMASCAALDDAEYTQVKELASEADDYLVERNGGEVSIKLYSNGKVTITPLNDINGWCTIDKTSFTGDDVVTVSLEENNSFRRQAKLLVSLNGGEKLDTICVRQKGDVAFLECAAPYKNVSGKTGSFAEFAISTNLPMELIKTEINYISGGDKWIKSVDSELGQLVVETLASSSDHASKASITISHLDGWDNLLKVSLYVTCSNKDGKFGTLVDFAKVRSLAGTGEINDDIYVEGVVVSDFHSLNMELNPSVNYDKVDVEENLRTAYIQTLDGKSGLRLKFDQAQENILAYGTKVSVMLSGVRVEKDADVDAYTVYGVGGENMVASETGDFIVKKVKKIAELTDEDIYTFVEIPGTEFINKDGAYTNVYENYTLKSDLNSMLSGNNDRLDGWAALLIDEDGKGIYAPINMLCQWRRTGAGVPSGVGVTKGVIVHHVMKRYGDVGRYQIRVLDESGFCQQGGEGNYRQLFKYDGSPYQYKFSQWKSLNSRYADPGNKASRVNAIIPSDDISSSNPNPVAELTIENKEAMADYPFSGFYSITGPSVNSDGCDRGFDPVRKALRMQYEIKGWFQWEGKEITGYNGLCYDFSTKDINASMLYFYYSFNVGTISAGSSQYYPAHWCVEYSLDGGNTYTICPDNVTGKEYVHLRTLPWWDATISAVKYFTCSSCGLGSTEHVAILPASLSGKENVRIRLRPYDNVMCVFPIQWNGEVETGRVLSNTTVTSTVINVETVYLRYR
ncbi:MAG: hypothetical protein MJY67_01245 [Bacteroidales bacterium]|nr:hypothetical protein [Bacteroidales bacterium]